VTSSSKGGPGNFSLVKAVASHLSSCYASLLITTGKHPKIFVRSFIFTLLNLGRVSHGKSSLQIVMSLNPLVSAKSLPIPSFKQWIRMVWQDVLILLLLAAVALGVSTLSTQRRRRITMLTKKSRCSLWNRNLTNFFLFTPSITVSHTPTVERSFPHRPVQRLSVACPS